MEQQATVRLGAAHHRDPVPLPEQDDPRLGRPVRGTQVIDGAEWSPYQASTFPTPPFAEYSSGHSNFSAAGAEILRLFTGSGRFGASVTFPEGSARFEAGAVPAQDVTLSWATFAEAADQAGSSRRYGGIHFLRGDLDGRPAGRRGRCLGEGAGVLERHRLAVQQPDPASACVGVRKARSPVGSDRPRGQQVRFPVHRSTTAR